jgi:hypothetical protein
MAENEMPNFKETFNDADFYLVPTNIQLARFAPVSVVEDFSLAGPVKAGRRMDIGERQASVDLVAVAGQCMAARAHIGWLMHHDCVTATGLDLGNA